MCRPSQTPHLALSRILKERGNALPHGQQYDTRMSFMHKELHATVETAWEKNPETALSFTWTFAIRLLEQRSPVVVFQGCVAAPT